MTTYIHIGSTKTGSSALQKFLFANREKLEERGFSYPSIGIKSDAHHLLAAVFHQNAFRMHENDIGDNIQETIVEYSLDLSEVFNNNKNVIISSEYLWNTRKRKEFIEFLRKSGAGEIVVIAYVREMCDWLQSQYTQSVKSGLGISFGEWFKKHATDKNSGFDYALSLESWQQIPGVNRVVARGYSKETLTAGLYADFIQFLGLDPSDFDYKTPEKVNPSPAAAETEVLAALNALSIPGREKAMLRSYLMHVAPQRDLFSDHPGVRAEEYDHIVELFSEGLRRVKSNFLHSDHRNMILLSPRKDTRDIEQRVDELVGSFLRIFIGLTRELNRGLKREIGE